MKTSDAFPSNYLKAADLKGKTPVVTIDRVDLEKVGLGRDAESKLVVYFKGTDKGLVLNKTNANAISDLLGTDETDNWPGQRIMLIVAMVEYQGKRVPAVRVEAAPKNDKPLSGKGKPAPKVVEPEPAFVEDEAPAEDDIPFMWFLPLLLSVSLSASALVL